jgi:ADP-ribose pyrophosphatase
MRRQIHRGRIVDLGMEDVTLPDGRTIELEIVRHAGAAAVAAVDERGCVVLIRQYRHAAGGYIWELPAGILKDGEPPAECAARELREEVGLGARRLSKLGSILTTPGFTDERIHLVLGREHTDGETEREDDEVIEEVRRVPLRDALTMVRDGEIVDSKTIAGLHLAAIELGVLT